MRALRTTWAAAWVLGMAPALASAQYTPADLLKFHPSQPGVEYDSPANQAEIDACKVENVLNAQKKVIGYALRDGQGRLLRRCVDTRGNRSLDQWSYYQDGFEVFRDNDLDDNLTIDECRWLNTGGTRIASVAKGKILAWKRLSAEEATRVLVQAINQAFKEKDTRLLETILATPEELASLGVPKDEVERVGKAASQRAEQVRALLKDLIAVGWDAQTTWLGFSGPIPHVIPADSASELKGDLTLYENASIFVGPPNGQGNSKFASLQVPELVQVGAVWKFVGVPRAIDPNKPITVVQEGGVRDAIFRSQAAPNEDPQLAAALKELTDYDAQHAEALTGGDKRKVGEFYVGRIPLIRNVIKLTTKPEDRLAYNRQVADSLAAAYQTGLYPKGLELLDALAKQEGGKLVPYIEYRKITADNLLKAEEGGNPNALQKELLTKLEEFYTKYPKSDEAAEALYQLALLNELNGEEDQARKFYGQLAKDFPDVEPGKKAAGALRRLDLVGKPIALKGTGLDGAPIDVASYRGKTLAIVFWATVAEPSRRDQLELMKVYEKHHGQGLEIIGVSLDGDKAALDAFLKANNVPWPTIFEPGGMDGRLANDYGILPLPAMFLVDAQGKVVNRSLRTAAELEKQLEKQGLDKSVNAAGLKLRGSQ
jgi:hypothetical protein